MAKYYDELERSGGCCSCRRFNNVEELENIETTVYNMRKCPPPCPPPFPPCPPPYCPDSICLRNIAREVCINQALLTNPLFGLAEIKTEVAAIEAAVLNEDFGLEEIKTEVAAIEAAVLSEDIGLEAISDTLEIFSSVNKTTGIARLSPQSVSFVLEIYNRSGAAVTSTVSIYSIAATTVQVYASGAQIIASGATFFVELPIADFIEIPLNFEVRFTNLPEGVYGFAATRTGDVGTGNLVAANTYRSSELLGF